MKRQSGAIVVGRVEKAATGTRTATQTRSIPSIRTGDEEAPRPSATYLRQLIRRLTSDATTPLTIRNECQNLMLAINANDLTEITERLACLLHLADRRVCPYRARRQNPRGRIDGPHRDSPPDSVLQRSHMSENSPPRTPPLTTCPRCQKVAVQALGRAGSGNEWFSCGSCGHVWTENRLTKHK